MSDEEKRILLNGKMQDWGPFGKEEGKWLIFSIGNPEEGHGYALPRNIDDLHSQRVAHLISCKTGGRYVAHIPWSTDTVGPMARDWSPKSIPVNEIVPKIIDFLQYHINIYDEMGFPTSNVFIYSGHGGNIPLIQFTEEIKSKLHLKHLIISPTEEVSDQIADKVLRELHKLSIDLAKEGENPKNLMRKYVKIVTTIDHADHFEHSLAATMGILDLKKLEIVNNELEKDFEAALKRWPPLGGLGGFLLQGGIYTEKLGTKEDDINGHWNCLKTLRRLNNGKIVVVQEIGDLIINQIVDFYSAILNKI